MLVWEMIHPQMTLQGLGYIPSFLDEEAPGDAIEQFSRNYIGGWRPFEGFKILPNGNLKYPGDPETQLLAKCRFKDQTLYFYQYSWMRVELADGSSQISRMD